MNIPACTELINILLKKGAQGQWGMFGACYFGNIAIIEYLTYSGIKCFGGHIEISRMIIQNGSRNYDRALYYALWET